VTSAGKAAEERAGGAIDVRPANVNDAPAIARVHVESWQATYPGIVPQQILDNLSVERRLAGWSRLLASPGEARVWIGELDGRVVGFAGTARPVDPAMGAGVAELETIYLLPVAQGRGLGRLLMRRATDDLVERGFPSAILWVLTDNERARRFYEAGGWRLDGGAQMLDFDGTPVEEIRYRIEFAGAAHDGI
jgi:GNAT superfamily N-acetyltransferase